MLTWILVVLLVIALGLNVHVAWLAHKTTLAVVKAQGGTAVAVAQLETVRGVVVMLNDELDRTQRDSRTEAREYMDRSMTYERLISEKNRQIGNMAERVASLKLVPGTEGGEDMHVEEVIPEKPYSPDLFEWVNGLSGSEVRVKAEDFIAIRRAHHIDDEQILREMEDEWDV